MSLAFRDPREILVGDRQISEQLGLGESRRLARIELPPGAERHGIDEPSPLVRKAGVGITAGDDRRGHAVVGLPGHKLLRPRRATGCDCRPDIVALCQLLHRIAAEQEIIEHALPDVLVEIGGKLGVRDAQGARRFHQPRAVDHAVLRVVEVVR